MKKFLLTAMAVLSLSLGFTACDDDEGGNSNYKIIENPASVLTGTYNGTYTRSLEGEEPKTADAVIEIAASEAGKEYVNVILHACSDLGVTDLTIPCNVSQSGNSFIVINGYTKNALGSAIRMYVDNQKDMKANFKLTVKNGRKSYEYYFEFIGNK